LSLSVQQVSAGDPAATKVLPPQALAGGSGIEGLAPRAGRARYRTDPADPSPARGRQGAALADSSTAGHARPAGTVPASSMALASAGFLAQQVAQERLPVDRHANGERLDRGPAAYRAAAGQGVAVIGPWRSAAALA